MKKKELEGLTNKERLQARSRDRLHSFILEEHNIRGAILHGTHMVNEMRLNHELGILETYILGHAYMGISLMTSNIKEDDRLAFRIDCSGPVKGLYAESNSFGEVRGYLKVKHIPIDKPLESFDLKPFLGDGFIEVIHYPDYAKQPYTGHVKLKYFNLASDLAHYYVESEQTPTYFNLSIKFDGEGEVIGAGGLLLQAMPDAKRASLNDLESIITSLPSIGDAFSKGVPADEIISKNLESFSPKVLSSKRIEFFCPCTERSILDMLRKMDDHTRQDILENGPFPLEVKCHNCNTAYQFSQTELETGLKQIKGSAETKD